MPKRGFVEQLNIEGKRQARAYPYSVVKVLLLYQRKQLHPSFSEVAESLIKRKELLE